MPTVFRDKATGSTGQRSGDERSFPATLTHHRHWAFGNCVTYAAPSSEIFLYCLGDIACLWAALQAFSAKPPPVAQLVIGYASGYAATRRALLLGGAGILEALLPFALSWVKIALAAAVPAVLAYRVDQPLAAHARPRGASRAATSRKAATSADEERVTHALFPDATLDSSFE